MYIYNYDIPLYILLVYYIKFILYNRILLSIIQHIILYMILKTQQIMLYITFNSIIYYILLHNEFITLYDLPVFSIV